MALNQRCGNPDCPKHHTNCGGEFMYSREKRDWFCKDCFYVPAVLNPGKNLWEFTTSHFTGQPIQVKGLEHLRQLEKEYGCSNHVANNMEKNWSTPPPVRERALPRELAEMIRR